MREIPSKLNEDYLQVLLADEMERLRKRFFKYQRVPFIYNPIEIHLDLETDSYAGCYKNEQTGEQGWQYKHCIYITKSIYDIYNFYCYWGNKRKAKREVLEVIRHELIHAFCYEIFEGYYNISGLQTDYSPIFLSCLYFAGGTTNHEGCDKFFETELFQKIKNVNSYDVLRLHLSDYIYKLEDAVKEINNTNSSINSSTKIDVTFGLEYDPGITAMSLYNTTGVYFDKTQKQIYNSKHLLLNIGFLVTAESIKNTYKHKLYCAKKVNNYKAYYNMSTGKKVASVSY